MNYTLLLNSVYLYLLQHPLLLEKTINMSALGRATNQTPVTAKREYQYLIDNNIDCRVNVLGITNFYNEVANATERGLTIYLHDFGDPIQTTRESAAAALGCSIYRIRPYWGPARERAFSKTVEERTENGIFIAIAGNKVWYVGATNRLIWDRWDYIKEIPAKALEYLELCYNIKPNEIRCHPVLNTDDYQRIQKEMVYYLQAAGNLYETEYAQYLMSDFSE